MPIVLKSGSLNLLEHSGPVQACNSIDLPLPYKIHGNTTTRPFGNYLSTPSSEATLTAELICFVVSVTSPGKGNSWFPKGRVVVLCVCDSGKGNSWFPNGRVVVLCVCDSGKSHDKYN